MVSQQRVCLLLGPEFDPRTYVKLSGILVYAFFSREGSSDGCYKEQQWYSLSKHWTLVGKPKPMRGFHSKWVGWCSEWWELQSPFRSTHICVCSHMHMHEHTKLNKRYTPGLLRQLSASFSRRRSEITETFYSELSGFRFRSERLQLSFVLLSSTKKCSGSIPIQSSFWNFRNWIHRRHWPEWAFPR